VPHHVLLPNGENVYSEDVGRKEIARLALRAYAQEVPINIAEFNPTGHKNSHCFAYLLSLYEELPREATQEITGKRLEQA